MRGVFTEENGIRFPRTISSGHVYGGRGEGKRYIEETRGSLYPRYPNAIEGEEGAPFPREGERGIEKSHGVRHGVVSEQGWQTRVLSARERRRQGGKKRERERERERGKTSGHNFRSLGNLGL